MNKHGRIASESADVAGYANADDFLQFFKAEERGLMQLATLMTANIDNAKLCFMRAREDCIASGSVVRGFIHTWAKRKIIQHAVLIVRAEDRIPAAYAADAMDGQSSKYPLSCAPQDRQFLSAILALPAFERLSYVIVVKEQYSLYNCALLLNSSPAEVNQAQLRARHRLERFSQLEYSPTEFISLVPNSEDIGEESRD